MPDYIAEVEFETVRTGKVRLVMRSEFEGLTQPQIQALFDSLAEDGEFAEILESGHDSGNCSVVATAPVARIQYFKQSAVETVSMIHIELDDYTLPDL